LGAVHETRRHAALLVLFSLSLVACSHLVEHSNAGISSLETDPGAVGAISRGAKYSGWAISAPLVAGMTPVAALAWATPWVDLSEAVDLASAPAIGFGYLSQSLVGFPAKGVLSLMRKARGSGWAQPATGRPFVPWGFVVEHLQAKRPARPAEEVPPTVQDYYVVSHEVLGRVRGEFSRRVLESKPDESPILTPLPSLTFQATLELYRAKGASALNPRPLFLMTPPTKAAFAARYLADRFARRGIHAAVIVPERAFLETHLTPAEVEARFRDAVVAARMVLRVLQEMNDVDTDHVHYLGISAGGIFGGVLLAIEPSIRRAVLVLPGGDLPRILTESEESSVVAYRVAWKARGVDPETLRLQFAKEARTDPQHLARFVEPHRVLLFVGASDTVVPVATGLSLRAALGDPETYVLEGNHDTAALCFGFILRRGERFLLEGR
jgi:dienelactone hydrolase